MLRNLISHSGAAEKLCVLAHDTGNPSTSKFALKEEGDSIFRNLGDHPSKTQ
jgi:hypothetical protein